MRMASAPALLTTLVLTESSESRTNKEIWYRTSSSVSGPRMLEQRRSPAALTWSLLLVSTRAVRKGSWSAERRDLGR